MGPLMKSNRVSSGASTNLRLMNWQGFVNAKNMKAGYRSWLEKEASEVDKAA